MPALSAIQHNKPIAQLHKRICEKNPTARKKGVTAGMRKLLVLIYTLWKRMKNILKITSLPVQCRHQGMRRIKLSFG